MRWYAATLLFFTSAVFLAGQDSAASHYEKGAAHFQSGRIDDAIQEFEAATRLAPSDPRPWKGMGVVQASQGRFSRAQEPFRKACDLEPRDSDACYYFGNVSHGLGRYEDAIQGYEKALRAGSRDARLYRGLGLAFEALGRNEDAERELRRAAEHDGGQSIASLDPRVELGAFLFRQGRLEEAEQVLETAVKARPDSGRAHFELARALVQAGRLDDAAARLREAVRLDPNHAATRLLLGKTYFRLGLIEEGRRETETGRKLSQAADQARVRAQQTVLPDPRPAAEPNP